MNKTVLAAALALATPALSLATGTNTDKQPAAAAAPAATTKAAPARTGTTKGKKAAAEEALVNKYVDLQDAAIKTFLELGSTLRGVKDKKSADTAAPTVKLAGDQLCLIIRQVESLGEPSEAAQQAIMARVANVAEKNQIVEQVMVPMLTLMMQEPPCHGSDSLHSALSDLLANLQGSAEAVEEEEEAEIEVIPLQEPDGDEAAEAK